MIRVSDDFKNAMQEPVKELQAFLSYNDVSMRDSDDLVEFKVSCESGLCKTAMRKLEAKYLGEYNLLGKWIHVGFGVKLSSGAFEYLDYGDFLVTEMTTVKDTGETTIVGYDLMIKTMTKYVDPEFTYPMTLYEYTKSLCEILGLKLKNTTLNVNSEWEITRELWSNIDGITYRDIFQQIAQATSTTAIITSENEIYFKPITKTNESLTYDNMLKLKLEPKYGEINSVVLSRDPLIGEDVFLKDDESIHLNGLTEFKITNNEIIDKDRENAITPIYNYMHGLSYYPFETNTEGLGWFEIADNIDIVNDSGEIFNTTIFNYSISIDGSIKETLKTSAETKTQSQYQYATSISKRVKNTEIIVNKQEENITSIVSDLYSEDGLINENFTKVYQDINNIVNSIQNSGGSNILLNSVMFAYDTEGIPTNWEVSGNGTLLISASAEALANGCLAGHVFVLNNKKAKQKVLVTSNNDTNTDKTFYTFSCRISKNSTGSCYVKLYNDYEEYIIEVPVGESAFYKEFVLQGLDPKDNYYYIEFYGSEDSDATFTDNMFALGEYKSQWTQANGEIMNTQVNINLDGVLVKSSVYLGDYTIMSPLEFGGYSNINGVLTKVFSLNKDTTFVKKLKAEDSISMSPIKIIPITTGELKGWAFVPVGKEVE